MVQAAHAALSLLPAPLSPGVTTPGDGAPFIPRHGEPRALSPVRLSLLALSLLAAASLVPGGAAAPRVPDLIVGQGTATTFQVLGEGLALEGGAYDWSEVCGPCDIRLATTSGGYTLVDTESTATQLSPGLYELRGFRGLFSFSIEGRHAFVVDVYGEAKVVRLG